MNGRVLVTGAFGYVGMAVIGRLSRSYDVTAFGHPPRHPAARAAIPAAVECVEGDIMEVGTVVASHGPFDTVIHLAGGGGPAKCLADPLAALRFNVRGTAALLEACRGLERARLLFASTIAVYGTTRAHDGPYREEDEAKPDDFYGALKESAEHLWTRLAGGTSLRIANVYGAGCGIDLGVQGAVERFARAAANGGVLSVFGTGEQRIDYVHVDDVVAAFERCIGAPSLPPIINVGGGSPISVASLAEECMEAAESLGSRPSLRREPAPVGKVWPDRWLAIDLAARAIGWRPHVSTGDGLAELVRMMPSNNGAKT